MGDAVVEKRQVDVDIQSLVIAPAPMVRINVGDADDFARLVENLPVKGLVWNERCITVLMDDRNTVVRFYPEIDPVLSVFLQRENGRRESGGIFGEVGPIIWEGEFEPVQFSKQRLLQFFQSLDTELPGEVLDAIRSLRVSVRREHSEEALDLESGDIKTIIEERTKTTMPRRFAVEIPVCPFYRGRFEFEARLVQKRNRYGEPENKMAIELRCLNARAVLRDMIQTVLSQLPPGIPRYYGAMEIEQGRR